MKKISLKIVSLLMVLILSLSIIPINKSLGASYGNIYVKVENYYSRAFEVLDIVNKERAKEGLGALSMDESLLESAMLRSAELSIYDSHTRPDGTSCFTANPKADGENIESAYYLDLTPTAAMQGWMSSEGHRANILTEGYKSIGIGCAYTNGAWYYVQMFSYDKATKVGVKKADELRIHQFKVDDSLISGVSHNIPSYIKLGSGLAMEAGGYTISKDDVIIPGLITLSVSLDPRSFTWSSSNPNVVKVDNAGTITGGDFGKSTITGKIGSKIMIQYEVEVNLPFTDVHESDYFYDSVVYNFLNKIISGTTLTKFSPNNYITRGQLVTILHRIEGYPKASPNATKFSDVVNGPYYDAIMWASDKGIVSGYGDGKFGPNNEITRAQLVTILFNYATRKNVDVSKREDITKYKDYREVKKSTEYAIDALSWAVANGIINGTNDGRLDPTGYAYRGQAAAIIANYCQNIGIR